MLVATRKGLFTIDRGDGGWAVSNTAFLGDRVSLALCDPRDGAWYAALDHGHFGVKLHRSTDEGATWPEITAPAYPPLPEDRVDVDSTGKTVDWSTKLIWALEPGGPDQPGVLWCGTLPGGVFKSTDSGTSWQLVESLWNMPERNEWFGGGADVPGVHSICVHPEDSNRVLVGVSCGGAWLTTDGGDTWTNRASGMWAAYMPPERKHDVNIQDPHMIVQCAASPMHYWTQHHNGVFKSTDGAETWTELENRPPSTFGFAVVVHPRDPNTAWFVPAISDEHRIPVDGKLVVVRTRDGGDSWDTLRAGLPQEHAYDLVFRHALDIAANGDTLAFGSTTGSVWVSDDQGESWAAISHTLPPIYAVHLLG